MIKIGIDMDNLVPSFPWGYIVTLVVVLVFAGCIWLTKRCEDSEKLQDNN